MSACTLGLNCREISSFLSVRCPVLLETSAHVVRTARSPPSYATALNYT